MSRAWAKGSTRRWRRIRSTILERDNHRCQLQIPGICTTTATCVHHTKGRAVTGDDPKHLIASCNACNQHVGNPNNKHHDPPAEPITGW